MEKALGLRFLKASLVYFVIGVTMGAIITVTPVYDFVVLSKLFERAHAHINLIGWVSLSIIGFIYYFVLGNLGKPMYSERLGDMGFWLINIGLSFEFIVLLLGGYAQASSFESGNVAAALSITLPYDMFLIIFAFVMLIGFYLSVYNIYKTMSS
jgi:cbb3-type cytochrome oxidase subunit 1